jgi:AcrR family transcriptional regulator
VRSLTDRRYRGASLEERQARRRAALIEAGLELLGSEGWAATTVRGVCARAGLTERYFYESFADRDALLLAVFDEVAGGGAAVIVDAVESGPPDAHGRARAAIGAFVEWLANDPRRGRVLLVEAQASEPMQRRRQRAVHTFAELVADQGRRHYGTANLDAVDASLTALVLVGGLAQLLVSWLTGDLDVPQDRLVDHCTALFVSAAGGVATG